MSTENHVTLAACPPGLFRFNGRLGFKSEYRDDLGCAEAFVVESGEAFWGGTTDKIVRDKLLVVPVSEHICFRHGDGEGLAKAVVEEYDKWLTAVGNRLREGERLKAIIQRTCFPPSAQEDGASEKGRGLPEDVRDFIERATLAMQKGDFEKHRTNFFQQGYALYSKYDVEGIAARNAQKGKETV